MHPQSRVGLSFTIPRSRKSIISILKGIVHIIYILIFCCLLICFEEVLLLLIYLVCYCPFALLIFLASSYSSRIVYILNNAEYGTLEKNKNAGQNKVMFLSPIVIRSFEE